MGFREVFAVQFLQIDHRSHGVSRKSHQAKAREIFARPCVALAFSLKPFDDCYLMFLSRSVVASAILIPTLVFAGANPPQAPKKPHEITEVGHTRNDPFFWLREKDNPEVLKYLEAENRYTESVLKHIGKLQETLYNEMRGEFRKATFRSPKRLTTITIIPGQRQGNSTGSTVAKRAALTPKKRCS